MGETLDQPELYAHLYAESAEFARLMEVWTALSVADHQAIIEHAERLASDK